MTSDETQAEAQIKVHHRQTAQLRSVGKYQELGDTRALETAQTERSPKSHGLTKTVLAKRPLHDQNDVKPAQEDPEFQIEHEIHQNKKVLSESVFQKRREVSRNGDLLNSNLGKLR